MNVTETQIQILTDDGIALRGAEFRPAMANGRAVIVNSAVGVWHAFYRPFAAFLAAQGFVSITYDYRGIGASQPRDRTWRQLRMSDWGEHDMAAVIEYVAATHSNRIAVVGHSVGAQLLGLAPNNDRVTRLLGIGAGTGHYGDYPMPAKAYLWTLWHLFVPSLAPLLGYFPGRPFGLGSRLPAGIVRQWASWGRDPRYVLGKNRPESSRNYEQFTGQFMSFGFEDDSYAPPSAVAALLKFYPSATTTHRSIHPSEVSSPAIGHTGFFKPQFRDTLWLQASNWLAGD